MYIYIYVGICLLIFPRNLFMLEWHASSNAVSSRRFMLQTACLNLTLNTSRHQPEPCPLARKALWKAKMLWRFWRWCSWSSFLPRWLQWWYGLLCWWGRGWRRGRERRDGADDYNLAWQHLSFPTATTTTPYTTTTTTTPATTTTTTTTKTTHHHCYYYYYNDDDDDDYDYHYYCYYFYFFYNYTDHSQWCARVVGCGCCRLDFGLITAITT